MALSSAHPFHSMVISDFAKVEQELAKYDLSSQIFVDAVLAGRDFYVTLTSNNPSYSHAHVTGAIVRELRDRTAANFVPETLFDGLDVTTHRSGAATILVVRGNRNTGRPNANPASHRSRGPTTPQLIPHTSQLPLPFSKDVVKSRLPDALVLLFYIAPKTKMIRLELSEPQSVVKVGKGWHFRGWRRRIIIPTLPTLSGKALAPKSPYAPQPSAGWTTPADPGTVILDRSADAI